MTIKSSVDTVRDSLVESARLKQWLAEHAAAEIARAAELVTASLRNGGKVMFCGNGGSAADSQHLAAELVGRYTRNGRALAAIALTTDSSALTAIANDFAYEQVFSRQVEALGKAGDVLVGISTSGNSANVRQAVEQAKRMGIHTIGLLGGDGGAIGRVVDVALIVPSRETPRIQESHIAIGHIICELVEGVLRG